MFKGVPRIPCQTFKGLNTYESLDLLVAFQLRWKQGFVSKCFEKEEAFSIICGEKVHKDTTFPRNFDLETKDGQLNESYAL